MADSSGLSKAAKKNKKKHASKKHGTDSVNTTTGNHTGISPEEVLYLIKEQLEIAKQNKDHALAGQLREQVWVLNDIIAGVKTNVPEEELVAIIESLPIGKKDSTEKEAEIPPPPSTTSEVLSEPEKRIRGLRKKLDQIKKLKEKQSKGEKIEKNQLDKIDSEKSIIEEIDELQKLVDSTLTFSR